MNVRFLQTPEARSADDAANENNIPCQETEITLLKDGDQVKTIVIKCACGRMISLDCTY